ncbi:MAG: DUF3667 domain-containing protein [Cyclobacteriaceae bacterium]|nr:DUF3667 domain-containing protein [Cyclobacteriaceae bacterium]UYN86611.1 MAG: DUF3667 domain-containing protein [Cyclobacteriaceae bacterium]
MDELGKSLPVSESIIESEQGAGAAGNPNCLNCGAPLTGKFCSQCGQKDLPRRQAVGDLSLNFISSFFSFESKFFKTFGSLLLKPGILIREYNEGKRERYYHPARMYVFLSFLFFLVFTLIPDKEKIDLTEDGRKLSKEETKTVLDTLNNIPWEKYEPKTFAEYDSIQNTKPIEKRDGKFERYYQKKIITLRQQRGWKYNDIWKNFGKSMQDNIPKMIFLLLPVFALILKLLYIRRDFYYSEHLVFTVFFYDFLFLAGIFGLLFSLVSWLEWINFFIFLYVNFYLYKAMRRVYGQSRFKTILKFFSVIWIFFFCITFAFVINALVTLILL